MASLGIAKNGIAAPRPSLKMHSRISNLQYIQGLSNKPGEKPMPYVYKQRDAFTRDNKEVKVVVGIGLTLAAFGILLILVAVL